METHPQNFLIQPFRGLQLLFGLGSFLSVSGKCVNTNVQSPAAGLRHPVCPVAAPGSQYPQSLVLGGTSPCMHRDTVWIHPWLCSDMEGIQQEALGPQPPQLTPLGNAKFWEQNSKHTSSILAAGIFSLFLPQIFTEHPQLKQTNNKQHQWKNFIQWFINVTLSDTQWIYGLSHELIIRGVPGEFPMEKRLLTQSFILG